MMFTQRSFAFAVFVFACIGNTVRAEMPRIVVSDNQRYLVEESGRPFFYLGDTVWELFHRATREEADKVLLDRARKGFTVIQAVALAEFDGLNAPNAYGHRPLLDNDPNRPATLEGRENDYWDHVDYVVNKANSLGLRIGLLPTWGDKWNKKWGVGPEIFSPDTAESYGVWLGNRYRNSGIIWILGGDRPIESDLHRQIIERMAKGLSQGDGGRHLKTFHPSGGQGSSQYFHDASWLDFNMRQNGHGAEYTHRYDQTIRDYSREPTKPVLDGEPIYEDHPINFKANDFGHSTSTDVRRAMYWNLLSGACGHTYGHHSVWQLWDGNRTPVNNPLIPWTEAIDQPGANQMQHGKNLMLSRPYLTRIPDPSLIVDDRVTTSVPGAGRYRFVAARDSEGSYAMVYAPVSRAFTVRLSKLKGTKFVAWWFNPRDGVAQSIGEIESVETWTFRSPQPESGLDWVLVIDQADRNFPTPGTVAP